MGWHPAGLSHLYQDKSSKPTLRHRPTQLKRVMHGRASERKLKVGKCLFWRPQSSCHVRNLPSFISNLQPSLKFWHWSILLRKEESTRNADLFWIHAIAFLAVNSLTMQTNWMRCPLARKHHTNAAFKLNISHIARQDETKPSLLGSTPSADCCSLLHPRQESSTRRTAGT